MKFIRTGHRDRSGEGRAPTPYTPTRCDVHPRRSSVCYVASGTGEVVRNGQVVKPGLVAGRNVCDECFEALVPRAIKS